MSAVFAIAVKDVRLHYNRTRDLIISIAIPIVLGVIFGSAMGGMSGGATTPAKIAVADEDGSAYSKRLIEKLRANSALNVDAQPLSKTSEAIERGTAVAALFIAQGFGAQVEQIYRPGGEPRLRLVLNPSDPTRGHMIEGLVQKAGAEMVGEFFTRTDLAKDFLARARKDLETAGAMDPKLKAAMQRYLEHQSRFIDDLERLQLGGNAPPMFASGLPLQVQQGTLQEMNPYAVVFPGVAVMFMMFSAMGGALSLLRERWRGVTTRLLAAPIGRFHILAGKSLAMFAVILLQFYVIFLFFAIVYGVLPTSWPGFILMSVMTALACSSLSIFIATLGKTEAAVHGIGMLLILVMSALGGRMIPTWVMPEWMQAIANFTLNRWAIGGMEAVLWRARPLAEIGIPCLTLGIWTLALLFAGSKLVKLR